jgi:hypothetical protein
MPGLSHATTSHAGRKNDSLRQWCKRLTRLTCAYGHIYMPRSSLHFADYNFCRVHRSLRVARDGERHQG